MMEKLSAAFPPGTPVRISQTGERRGQDSRTETFGVVETWADQPTGSWFAHGKDDRLWLTRLRLRKRDGEVVSLVIDDQTAIAKLVAHDG